MGIALTTATDAHGSSLWGHLVKFLPIAHAFILIYEHETASVAEKQWIPL